MGVLLTVFNLWLCVVVCIQALRYNYSSDEKYAFVEVSVFISLLIVAMMTINNELISLS